jgi:hypothetical protein
MSENLYKHIRVFHGQSPTRLEIPWRWAPSTVDDVWLADYSGPKLQFQRVTTITAFVSCKWSGMDTLSSRARTDHQDLYEWSSTLRPVWNERHVGDADKSPQQIEWVKIGELKKIGRCSETVGAQPGQRYDDYLAYSYMGLVTFSRPSPTCCRHIA